MANPIKKIGNALKKRKFDKKAEKLIMGGRKKPGTKKR